jgi:FixJ family two-component response regulator
LLDTAMPQIDGLALRQTLCAAGIEQPIIFLNGNDDIPMTPRAMKTGAIFFSTKPVDTKALLAAIARARNMDSAARPTRDEIASVEARLARLTLREGKAFIHVVARRLNEQIAGDLGIVEKTNKVHRARMMMKLEVRTVADLVRLAERAHVRCPGLIDSDSSICNADRSRRIVQRTHACPRVLSQCPPRTAALACLSGLADGPSGGASDAFCPAHPQKDNRRLKCASQILVALSSSPLAPALPSHRRLRPRTPRPAETRRCTAAWRRLERL